MSGSSANVTTGLCEMAERAPDRPALIFGNRRVSFAQLDAAVWAAAALLTRQGVSRGDVLPLCLTDQIGLMVALLGAMRLGATPLSLPPSLTAMQRRDTVREVGALFQVVSDPASAAEGVSNLRFDLTKLPQGDHRHLLDPSSDHPCIILFGSGSTGKPLLIPVSHAAMRARATTHARGFGFQAGERFFIAAPAYFASPTVWFIAAVTHGLTGIFWDVQTGLRTAIRAACPDYAHLTVMHAHRLLKEADQDPDLDLSHMKQVSVAASPVSQALRTELKTRLGARLAINYGTNENGLLTVASPEDLDQVENTIGRPQYGTEIQIVDDLDRPVSSGEIGNIRVRAAGSTDGYFGGAASERFRHGWFYPGDLALWREGQIVHCGRSDQMMLMDGINIYPSEIERCLERHPAVAEAAAFPLEHKVHGQVPVCVVTLKAGKPSTVEELMDYVRQSMGSKRPRRIAIVDRIPRNDQGKLTRAKIMRHLMAAGEAKTRV